MEEAFEVIVNRTVAPLMNEIIALRQQVDAMQGEKLSGKMLTAVEAGKIVGRSACTITRWCRGIMVDGVKVKLNAQRSPNGRYVIDQADLLAFNKQVTENYVSETSNNLKPASMPGWNLTREKRPRNKS